LKVLISVLFFALANISFAEDMRYYDIEVVIIENLNPAARKSENWPLHLHLAQPEKIVPLGEPVPKLKDWLPKDVDLKISYKSLDSSTYQLTEHVKKLSESESKRVIFHTAWRQPGLDKHQALPVYFKREIPVVPDVENNSATETQPAVSTSSELEGILRVTLARYLHLEAELSLRDKLPETTSDNPFEVLDRDTPENKMEKQGIIHLKQQRRRIRSTELHYLDHPVLGVLLLITPHELSEDATTVPKAR
ncbi:MAG: peptidoglycan binding protein CsiV, partial [Gammaproteobacteria bacterium]|nr:peptidoglycan binding protein CsiV [Gammaproteobacteria bacterium]